MSTSVPMPVRIEPPPPEIGEIISPGCAAFATITPVNGARITVLSTPSAEISTPSRATLTDRSRLIRRAARESRSAIAASNADAATSFFAARSFWRASVRSASTSCARASASCDCAEASCDCDSSRCAPASDGSRRARISPSTTCWPSSINTSLTLPVIFDDTVAMRRAVM